MVRGKKGLVGLAVLGVLAVGCWFGRQPLLTWYYLRGLSHATEADRDSWAQRVASLEQAAVPGLFDCLRGDEPAACANARAALACLVRRWGAEDPRCLALADQLAGAFPDLSLPGRLEVMRLQALLVPPAQPQASAAPGLVQAAGRILTAAANAPDGQQQEQALALADLLADRVGPGPLLTLIHDLARAGLKAAAPGSRARAVHLVSRRALREQGDLLALVLPLLHDGAAEVRREALRAVDLRKELVGDEELLAWLHDPDAEVRTWCVLALRARGRSESDIQLGRLLTDGRARERLKIFAYLHAAADQEPGVWIRRLCDDPEPAVRIAAARAAAEQDQPDLADRLREMAQSDQSPTVRQVAEAYAHMKRRVR